MRLLHVFGYSAGIASVLANIIMYKQLHQIPWTYANYPSERLLIEKTLRLETKENSHFNMNAAGRRIPVTFYTTDMICVDLRLKKGVGGEMSTYCFSKETGQLVDHFVEH